jgi:RNA binding exosome subunit
MSEEYIYIVSGGALKAKHVKIGYTQDSNSLRDRYKTYYGDNMQISYVKVNNNDDGHNIETRIRQRLTENGCSYSNELFKCSCSDAKTIIKEETGKNRMTKC